jgi:transposase InsO family protein
MYEKLQLDYECRYSYNTVAKVMRDNGLLQKANRPKGLTKADKAAQKSSNLLNRDFSAEAPNQKMVTDIIEYAACDGKVYVSGIFDCFDSHVMGLCMDDNMRVQLCVRTLRQAMGLHKAKGVILHSDRGSQYTSGEFRACVKGFGVAQSMKSAGG